VHHRWAHPARALAISVGVLALVGCLAVLAPSPTGPCWPRPAGGAGQPARRVSGPGCLPGRVPAASRALEAGRCPASARPCPGRHPPGLGRQPPAAPAPRGSLRVTSVVRRAGLAPGAATASTVVLRAPPTCSAWSGSPSCWPPAWSSAGSAPGGGPSSPPWPRPASVAAGGRPGCLVIGDGCGCPAQRWCSGRPPPGCWRPLVWQAARWAGLDLSPLQALLVTVVSVAAQVLAVASGGLGTYEAAAVAAYVMLGHRPGRPWRPRWPPTPPRPPMPLAAGALAPVVPAPGVLGRLRLPPLSQPEDPATPPRLWGRSGGAVPTRAQRGGHRRRGGRPGASFGLRSSGPVPGGR
jgi:hypothetical protein